MPNKLFCSLLPPPLKNSLDPFKWTLHIPNRSASLDFFPQIVRHIFELVFSFCFSFLSMVALLIETEFGEGVFSWQKAVFTRENIESMQNRNKKNFKFIFCI
ncbi:MAG: hypothetical protein AMJ60_01860 [Desulfobacterales bacterium SG8_35]|nr:MAG: hypothetical protein AMJ60_01860 [Desulfobacterales bacterium SG8_35]